MHKLTDNQIEDLSGKSGIVDYMRESLSLDNDDEKLKSIPHDLQRFARQVENALIAENTLTPLGCIEQKSIKLSAAEIGILGRPNFACSRAAWLLITAGVYEKRADTIKKSEYEQAVYIHWAQTLFNEHGEKWVEVGYKVLVDCSTEIAKTTPNGN